MPEIGEILQYKQERGNMEDLYTVSVIKGDTIVGHVLCEKSCVVWYFIKHDGVVTCQVINQQNTVKFKSPLYVHVCIISLYALNRMYL